MRWSLTTSLVLHAALLIAALVVLPNPNPHKVAPPEAIQVDISKIGDTSKRMALAKDADKDVEKPKPKKTETVKETKPAPKIAEEVKTAANKPVAEPEPEPKKEEPKPLDPDPLKDLIKETEAQVPEPKKEEPKKEEKKKAEIKPKDKPKPEKKKKPKLDVDQLEAFLNKVDEEKTAPAERADETGETAKAEKNLQGTDSELSATIIEALVQRIRECWTVPPGAREANIVVKLRFGLNTDGTVAGSPQVMNSNGDPLFETTARSAVAAVLECQAYSFLPQDKYDLWRDLIINFNPNMMFDS